MNLLHIAWRNFQQRALSSVLTTVSLALGVALVVLVLAVYGIIEDSFKRNSAVSYNLVVGSKGSPLQLTLSTVFYLSQPNEPLPYRYYMEFMSGAERQRQYEAYGGRLDEPERDGKFAPFMRGGFAIPVTLGDYFGRFRVVGTTPDFFDTLQWGRNVDRPYEFAEGRNFQEHSDQYGYFEAVVGSRVAAERDVGVGDEIYPAHGDPEGHGHDLGFTIVGVLEPTGTPTDRAAFVNLEGFYLMDGHAKPVEEEEEGEADREAVDPESTGEAPGDGGEAGRAGEVAEASQGGRAGRFQPLPIHQREVTAILVRPAMPAFARSMQNVINEGLQATAAAPIGEITNLMELIVSPLRIALLAITLITCVVAGVGIMVSIYNSMSDRRRDIAVMRALGARRGTVMSVILLESLLIAVIGGIAGWLLAHAAIAASSGFIERRTGAIVGFLTVSSAELYVLPLVLLLAALAGFLPALVAYRTDVSRALAP